MKIVTPTYGNDAACYCIITLEVSDIADLIVLHNDLQSLPKKRRPFFVVHLAKEAKFYDYTIPEEIVDLCDDHPTVIPDDFDLSGLPKPLATRPNYIKIFDDGDVTWKSYDKHTDACWESETLKISWLREQAEAALANRS